MNRPDLAQERLEDLRAYLATSERSQQAELGMSELGHECPRYIWSVLHHVPTVNTSQHVLAAMRGTGVHKVLEPYLESRGWTVEAEVEYGGVPGHVDAYRDGIVEDEKSALTSKVRALAEYGPSKAWRYQLHTYARALNEKGEPIHTVRIVAYAIDSSDEITVWEEPYSPEIADEAVSNALRIAALDDPPAPGMDLSWCERFCKFYDATGERGCPSRASGSRLVELEDSVLRQAAVDLRAARDEVKDATQRKKAAEAVLEGVNGLSDGYAITQVTVQASEVPDDEAIRSGYAFVLGELPTREKAGYSYVSVRKARAS